MKTLKSIEMPSYVYHVRVKLSHADSNLFPDEAWDLSQETILFQNERKAKNFVMKTLQGYAKSGEYEIMNPAQGLWWLCCKVTGVKLSIQIREVHIRT